MLARAGVLTHKLARGGAGGQHLGIDPCSHWVYTLGCLIKTNHIATVLRSQRTGVNP